MTTFVRGLLPQIVFLALLGTIVGAGCGQQAATQAEQAKAFAGDPAMKAKMGAAMRDKALQAAPQGASAAQNAAQAKAREEARTQAAGAPTAR